MLIILKHIPNNAILILKLFQLSNNIKKVIITDIFELLL